MANKSFRVFLTTDNAQVYADFKANYDANVLVHNDGPFNHIDYIPFSADPTDCSTSEKAVLDFHCLAECDAVVISRSQFGRMGVWRRSQPSKDVYAYNTDLDEFVEIKDMRQFRLS